MSLTQAQNTALKTDIEANTDPVVINALAGGADSAIANWYNNNAVPDYWVWRTNMPVSEIRETVDWSEVVNRTTNDLISFQVLTSADDVDPSKASVRQAFQSIFSGGTAVNSRTALETAARRLSTEGEKVFVVGSGDGSTGDPDNLDFEGNFSAADITVALRDG